MEGKIHLVTLYTLVTAVIPIVFYLNGYYAHAADVERTNAQIMLEIQQISIDSRLRDNNIHLNTYSNKMKEGNKLKNWETIEFDGLQENRRYILNQQNELDSLRQEIK